jgi:ubiquinone/menaquinone biosynthesis C-methylase UbiE
MPAQSRQAEVVQMFSGSAKFYDALYRSKDYAAASDRVHALIQQYNPRAETLLDLGCGTGRHLEVLRNYYQPEGLDLNSDLLVVAAQRCPDVPLHRANMIDFALDHKFDAITCLFSSIAYVRTKDNLDRTMVNIARHLQTGGVVIVEPWFSPERYWTGRVTTHFVDDPELKIASMYTNDPPENQISVLNIHYLVGTPAGIERFEERHELGLFTDEEYMSAFEKANLEVIRDEEGLFGRGLFIGLG